MRRVFRVDAGLVGGDSQGAVMRAGEDEEPGLGTGNGAAGGAGGGKCGHLPGAGQRGGFYLSAGEEASGEFHWLVRGVYSRQVPYCGVDWTRDRRAQR